MSNELLIFVGYSGDARDEALAVCDLSTPLQESLRGLNHVAAGRSRYSHLVMFNWEEDADVGVGGQDFAINPHLARSAVAIFVFKGWVGPMTWRELESCRNRPVSHRIPTFVVFADSPPNASELSDRDRARAWADLLERRHLLTADWGAKGSLSVTPLPAYRDKDHLKEILRHRLMDLLPSLITPEDQELAADDLAPQTLFGVLPDEIDHFLDKSAQHSNYDASAVRQYRELIRNDVKNRFPEDLSPAEFLQAAGYLRAGSLTIAGALLFSRRPVDLIPSAIVRCTKFEGQNRATPRRWLNCDGPLLTQIVDAREFVASNVRQTEMPVDSSMQSATRYEYPMVCVRELLANAVCHRDYSDTKRLIYVTLYDDRLEIRSPGQWSARALTESRTYQLSALASGSVQRNMRLAHAISSVGMMEVEGSGILTSVEDCVNCACPGPVVEYIDGYVCVTIFPRAEWSSVAEEPAAHRLNVEPTAVELGSPLSRPDDIVTAGAAGPVPSSIEELIGSSPAFLRVLRLIERVAQLSATVLISGESGTGKELVARAIHRLSPRREAGFVAFNCAAVPRELFETSLFGHERGAFTGAIRQNPGRLQMADSGTLFLDEIGDLPLALQSKLLRVLQDAEFERVGGSLPIRVDVRFIAATNKDLRKEVVEGRFREDLYYRLNVVPIELPPLRERRADIPELVSHFLAKLARKLGRPTAEVSRENMTRLMQYDWPGNIRQLQNVLERALMMSDGTLLEVDEHFLG